MRPVSFLLTLSIAVPARAEPLQIHGTTGYVSEYELSGSVSERDLNGEMEFSGPLIVRHVGLNEIPRRIADFPMDWGARSCWPPRQARCRKHQKLKPS